MESALEKMEAQLKHWSLRIDRLAAKTEMAGVQKGFDALIYVDELKALYAIVHSKFVEFKSAEETRQVRLKAELKSAWDDLEAAFNKPSQ